MLHSKFEKIPTEILSLISSFLRVDEFSSIGTVSHRLAFLSSRSSIWKTLIQKHFPDLKDYDKNNAKGVFIKRFIDERITQTKELGITQAQWFAAFSGDCQLLNQELSLISKSLSAIRNNTSSSYRQTTAALNEMCIRHQQLISLTIAYANITKNRSLLKMLNHLQSERQYMLSDEPVICLNKKIPVDSASKQDEQYKGTALTKHNGISNEIISYVLSFLGVEDFPSLNQTGKIFHHLLQENSNVWVTLLQRHFPNILYSPSTYLPLETIKKHPRDIFTNKYLMEERTRHVFGLTPTEWQAFFISDAKRIVKILNNKPNAFPFIKLAHSYAKTASSKAAIENIIYGVTFREVDTLENEMQLVEKTKKRKHFGQ